MAPKPLDNIVVRLLIGSHLYSIKEFGAKVKAEDEAAVMEQIWRQAYRMPPIKHSWSMFKHIFPLFYRQLNTDWLAWWNKGPESELKAVTGFVNHTLLEDQELFSRADSILSTWERLLKLRMSAAGGTRWEFLLKFMVFIAVGPKRHRQVMADMMAGIQTPTVTLNEELWQLSCLARKNQTVLSCVKRMEPGSLLKSEEGRKFTEFFEKFIEKYGHREGTCWYLTPLPGGKTLTRFGNSRKFGWERKRTGNPTQARTRRIAAFSLVEKRLHFLPCFPNILRWLRYRLYRMNVFREKSHYDLTRPLDALQEITKEWARRLLDRGVLENESDVGFLTYDEIRKWLCEIPPEPGEARRFIAPVEPRIDSSTLPGRRKEKEYQEVVRNSRAFQQVLEQSGAR